MKKYEITKEQIEILIKSSSVYVANTHLENWFPEAFRKELVIGKWYNYNGALLNYQGKTEPKHPILRAYGIVPCNGGWKEESNFGSEPNEWTEATEPEVFEALKNEAVKRYKDGDFVNSFVHNKTLKINNSRFEFYCILKYNQIYFGSDGNNCVVVFENGKWAEIIPTIKKEEAEKQLGKKIID